MLAAIAVGWAVSRRSQRSLGINWRQRLGLGFGALCGAMVGAKLPFLFADWDRFLDGSAWFADGKTIVVGLVGGYLGVEAAKWSMGLTLRTGDTFVIPVALAIAVGRWACFYAGCCYGAPTELPWGVVFPAVDQVPRHPAQLYEFLFHLTAAGVFAGFQRAAWFRYEQIKLYIIGYAVYRFVSEWWRPEPITAFGLTAYQLASLVIIVLFIWLWYRSQCELRSGAVPATPADARVPML